MGAQVLVLPECVQYEFYPGRDSKLFEDLEDVILNSVFAEMELFRDLPIGETI